MQFSAVRVVGLLVWGSKFALVILKNNCNSDTRKHASSFVVWFGGFETGSQYVAQAGAAAQIGLELVSRAHSTRHLEEHICSFPHC